MDGPKRWLFSNLFTLLLLRRDDRIQIWECHRLVALSGYQKLKDLDEFTQDSQVDWEVPPLPFIYVAESRFKSRTWGLDFFQSLPYGMEFPVLTVFLPHLKLTFLHHLFFSGIFGYQCKRHFWGFPTYQRSNSVELICTLIVLLRKTYLLFIKVAS